ncbi:MAG: hypothetical protein KTU85_01915 [Acidimicrobiia bacterium]|nr:hypothetical protein [Acidimicrobiia bacterium]MCY4457312.1 hypothetical protein [Acidimicrobiaceae bacterium]
MSSAVIFLLAAVALAILGSLILWLWHRARSAPLPSFSEHLKAIAPRKGSAVVQQPPGVVTLDREFDEELRPGP